MLNRSPRGFTLVELVVVVGVIGVAGAAAMVGISDTLATARAQSERQHLLLDLRGQRTIAQTHLKGIVIEQPPAKHDTLRYSVANLSLSGSVVTCTIDATSSHDVQYPGLDIKLVSTSGGDGKLCLDANGAPVDRQRSTVHIGDGKVAALQSANVITVEPVGSIKPSFGASRANADNGAVKASLKSAETAKDTQDAQAGVVQTVLGLVVNALVGLLALFS